MSITLSEVEVIVRGIIIDAVETGTTPFFSETEVVRACNMVKDDYFGIRPEAFSSTAVSIIPPTNISSTRNAVLFTEAETVIGLPNLPASFAEGNPAYEIESFVLGFKTSQAGPLLHIGDGSTKYLVASVESGGARITLNAGAGESTALLSGSFMDGRWHTLTVFGDGTIASVQVDNVADVQTVAWTEMPIIDDATKAYIGFTNYDGSDAYFDGAVDFFEITRTDDVAIITLEMDEGSGVALVDAVAANNAEIYGPTIEWLSDDPLEINNWAVQTYCYGVASLLLMQRGKDSFYRKAAEALRTIYLGG